MRKELDKQLDEMERNNIIEESTSPWHSPVVLVKKRNGSIRVCVDYRALNRITEPMSAVIPTMTDIFDTLADSKPELFSSLDLTSGFWQVPLDPTTKHKSAFITHKGVYEFNRLPFDGIRVNPENTEKVKDFSRPTTAKQVKSFLGMANYYRKFVKDYAHIAAPLTKLLKKDQRFKWTSECDIAFQNLKDRLTSAPILSFPHLDKPFILATDSSEFSNGYILSQIQNGLEHVIAYGGRQLRGSELKWHITDKEALALVEGVQHFKHYLANQEFTVYTDNISVKYLQKIKDCQGRLGRVPQNPELARAVVAESYNFELEDGILKHFYSKRCKKVPKDERLVKQIAVPRNLRDSILKAYHDCILEEDIKDLNEHMLQLETNIFGHRCIVTLINM
ncbi:Hypothetical predicted protein [Mytilus galloprovincialis]|uniref:Reverse transcriptase/retrotransposon-derived protein RNase H-like domain-containing protein n=1 Tax=Mytilus galloprovincialis TaxID=29158 RepID=A0A8B6CGN4_MYTGA|nr:Hypothetical predicted protein [Mytilus galloprovincialis]